MGVSEQARQVFRRIRREVRTWKGLDVRAPIEVSPGAKHLGTTYGGWSVIPTLVHPGSVVYGVGVGHDASWDLAMIQRFACHVHAFDPTPRSRTWVESQSWPDKFHFHPWGLAGFDGEATFVMPNADPNWSSYEMRAAGTPGFEEHRLPVRRLDTIMKDLGHTRLDVLKMDIEGGEYDVLPHILETSIRPTQLLIEFHYHEEGKPAVQKMDAILRALREAGYRIFDRSPHGPEFCLIRQPSEP